MTKALIPTEMSNGRNDNTKNTTKQFDYTAISDRHRTVSWSNYNNPTGVVNRITGQTYPLPATDVHVHSYGHTFENFVNKPSYIDNKSTATPSGEVIKIDTQTT